MKTECKYLNGNSWINRFLNIAIIMHYHSLVFFQHIHIIRKIFTIFFIE